MSFKTLKSGNDENVMNELLRWSFRKLCDRTDDLQNILCIWLEEMRDHVETLLLYYPLYIISEYSSDLLHKSPLFLFWKDDLLPLRLLLERFVVPNWLHGFLLQNNAIIDRLASMECFFRFGFLFIYTRWRYIFAIFANLRVEAREISVAGCC